MSSVWVELRAQPIADNEKRNPDMINEVFLPNLSEISPAIPTPIIQPTKAELTNQPSMTLSSSNLDFTKPIVPEITAVSYPKRNPPNAAVRVIKNKYFELGPDLSLTIFPEKLQVN
jgi:hypothetical protein